MKFERSRAWSIERSYTLSASVERRGALHPLDAEALHDAYARHALLHHAGDVGELLLQLHPDRVHAVVEPGRGEVEQRQQAEREQREARAAHHEDHDHRAHLDRARDRQRHEQDDVVDLLDVGVRVRHQLTGLRLIVEGEVQPLEMRDESQADVGLHPPGQAERGVAPQPGPERLHRADSDDRGGQPQGDAGAPARDAVVDRLPREQRDRHPRRRPYEPGEDAEDHELRVGADRFLHQAPAPLAGLAPFELVGFPARGALLFRLSVVVHLERGYQRDPDAPVRFSRPVTRGRELSSGTTPTPFRRARDAPRRTRCRRRRS